jgi:hypothetical protein
MPVSEPSHVDRLNHEARRASGNSNHNVHLEGLRFGLMV